MELIIDIWSDCVCPYCYAGKRNLERALNSFAHREKVKVVWHSFQLHPELPINKAEYYYDFMSEKLGISIESLKERLAGVMEMAADASLEYNLEKAMEYNTFNAHRIIQKAKEKGLGNEMEESIFKAFFTDGKDLSKEEVLISIAISTGLSAQEIEDALTNEKYFNKIWEDFKESDKREVELVPTFFFPDGSKIVAAPKPEVFLEAMEKAWSNLNN